MAYAVYSDASWNSSFSLWVAAMKNYLAPKEIEELKLRRCKALRHKEQRKPKKNSLWGFYDLDYIYPDTSAADWEHSSLTHS